MYSFHPGPVATRFGGLDTTPLGAAKQALDPAEGAKLWELLERRAR